jgi:APA family basic amino acid/polyamine antiporter
MRSSETPAYLRSLRPWDAALIVVGGIIGGGIFLNPGIAAQRTDSGLTLLLMWIGAGVLTLIGALCYAELGARRPHAGGIMSTCARRSDRWPDSCSAGPCCW